MYHFTLKNKLFTGANIASHSSSVLLTRQFVTLSFTPFRIQSWLRTEISRRNLTGRIEGDFFGGELSAYVLASYY